MSHESLQPGRAVIYNLPTLFSDSLRSLQFSQFFEAYRGAPFAIRTADGWSWTSPGGRAPECTAQFRNRADLDAVLGDSSEAALGRIFLDGGLEIHGNIFSLLAVAEYALLHSDGLSSGMVQTLFRISSDITRRLQRVRRPASPQNWQCAPCPLDLPAEFFAPWLGSSLVHCCGSFRKSNADLDGAQSDALDRACNWLDVSSSDDLLDVGCGWGSLSMHAARYYHASSCGITANQPQAEWAAESICRGKLASRCHVLCRDLRRSPYPAESFNKVATLGVFEQIPSADFGRYLKCVKRMLAPGGLLLLHRMTPTRTSGAHLRTLHPGLPAEPLSKDLTLAEAGGWELVNVETMQRDYEETLRIWIGRLRQNSAELSHSFPYGYRAWLLYLVEIATSLHAEELQVHRVLLRRPSRARTVVC